MNLGVVVLGMVLIISLVAVFAFLIVPLALRGGRQQRARAPALLRRGRPRIHPGRNRFHPALRAFPRTSDVRAHRGRLPAAALERSRQPGLTPLAVRTSARRGCPSFCCWRPSLLYVWILPGTAVRADRTCLSSLKLAGERRDAGPARLRHGHAVSHRPARASRKPRRPSCPLPNSENPRPRQTTPSSGPGP